MAAWVWITCAAALSQTLRFMLQKQLAGASLSASGATYARFLYSAPLVCIALYLYLAATGTDLPQTNGRFWQFALAGGLAQILATIVVVALFSLRNFAVGITFKKTEVMQTAVFGLILLGDRVSTLGLIGIVTGFAGVLFLSRTDTGRGQRFSLDRSAALGLLSGALFGVSGVCYRGASLALETGDFALRAAVTLAFVTACQLIAMTLWLVIRDSAEILKVLRAWRKAALVGITSMIGSYCWFMAFTLQQAAYVNAVGQIELLFSIGVSVMLFNERISRNEGFGMALIVASILIIVLGL